MAAVAATPIITVREVGPRDGLQMVGSIVPTVDKLRWIGAMAAAGVRDMEVTSFVPASSLPQFSDAGDVVAQVARKHPELRAVALAPNLRGAANAVAAGARVILVPVSASEAHSRANVRRSTAEQIDMVRRLVAWAKGLELEIVVEAAVSTAFGCSLQGPVAEADVIAIAADLAEAGADRVLLADTLGYATPSHVRRLVRSVRQAVGAERFGNLHLHDTLGMALANVVAALEEGVTGFDGALGGLGGCPYAPGSVGNVATEDLVYMLESEGLATGIDLPRLLEARALLASILPGEPLQGRVAAAGLPTTYRPSSSETSRPHPKRAAPDHGPLSGIRVVEFSHMVMGPSCGLVLADLGADVIKVEPAPAGDNSRRLRGVGTGFFPTYNRNKRSLCVDLKSGAGLGLVQKLVATADVVVENFRPGAMDKLGLGYEALSQANSRLIYCACKGFLPGPYDHRAALDEVVQMMGGLAWMTGPPGKPMRAGASVNDIMGGVFGAVAVLAALRDRDRTGKGGLVQSGLFETNALLVGQHMAYAAINGEDLPSFGDPASGRPWPVYDIFDTDEPDQQVFVGAVTETQWKTFCAAFGLEDFRSDPGLQTMSDAVAQRPRILRRVAEVFRRLPKLELMQRLEALGLPFAPIGKPSDMLADPHLKASGGLLETELYSAVTTVGQGDLILAGLPALPISLAAGRFGLRLQPPKVGEHSIEIALEAGLSAEDIESGLETGAIMAGLHAHAQT